LTREENTQDDILFENMPQDAANASPNLARENQSIPTDEVKYRGARYKSGALSMNFVKCLGGLVCQECGTDPIAYIPEDSEMNAPSDFTNLQALQRSSSSSISPLVLAPMMMKHSSSLDGTSEKVVYGGNGKIESIMGEYMALCQFYKIPYNAGVLSTLRFSLPCLRVTGSFHDLDSKSYRF
jgi:hypothetical protein